MGFQRRVEAAKYSQNHRARESAREARHAGHGVEDALKRTESRELFG